MQLLFALGPLAAFFITFRLAGIYAATAVLMGAMLLVCVLELLRFRRVTQTQLLSTLLVLVFGGATLLLRNPMFIKWKASVFLWLMALAFLGSSWIGERTLAQRLLQAAVPEGSAVPAGSWQRMNGLWVVWTALLGGINLWLAYHASDRAWVNFKTIGLPVAWLALSLGQVLWLQRGARGQGGAGAVGAAGDPATRVARIRACLETGLQPSALEVQDDSAAHRGHASAGGLGHFRVRIVSQRFAGLTPLARHRLVNDTLAPLFATDIHALSIEASAE